MLALSACALHRDAGRHLGSVQAADATRRSPPNMSSQSPRNESDAAVTGPEGPAAARERKSAGGVLKRLKSRRSQPDRRPVTEEELRALGTDIGPDEVLGLRAVTRDYLCKPEHNVYNVDFTRFKIRDLETNTVLFEIAKPPNCEQEDEDDEGGEGDSSSGRFVRYQFTPAFLRLRTVGATVEFTVGDRPVSSFRMIERHYFRDQLLKSFDFDFGFCIPNSRNTCEHIYEFPQLPEDMIRLMVAHPYETRSDSFYFVDNKLIMHNKADYAYNGGQ
ncbi:protein unc-119 homolog B-like isoform X2 [Denticeps clupeoides]|uniref:GMP phosphodiesterase delta subunit domain-containing protein n=1 Tax=Denticeps clupeoides TaxID=299321 RepID=A0AAY4EHS4_9TELE|nr:protein unc-119 homolog B-like isoform X2 [Denticeps clupeoides]